MEIQSDNNLLAVRLTQEGKTVQSGAKHTAKPDNTIAAALDNGFEAILNKALHPVNDKQLIEQTKLDLREGRLESDSAFDKAAENLFTYGL